MLTNYLKERAEELEHSFQQWTTARFRSWITKCVRENDPDVLDKLETFVCRSADPSNLLHLIQQRIAYGRDITRTQECFLDLFARLHYSTKDVDQFLKIIDKDHIWMAKHILNRCQYGSLSAYIQNLDAVHNIHNRDKVKDICNLIIFYSIPKEEYIDLMLEAIPHVCAGLSILLENESYTILDSLEERIVVDRYYDWNLVSAYATYLNVSLPHRYNNFEDQYFKYADAYRVFQYAQYLPGANKRKALKRLIYLGEEDVLVQFIQENPNFRLLLPML